MMRTTDRAINGSLPAFGFQEPAGMPSSQQQQRESQQQPQSQQQQQPAQVAHNHDQSGLHYQQPQQQHVQHHHTTGQALPSLQEQLLQQPSPASTMASYYPHNYQVPLYHYPTTRDDPSNNTTNNNNVPAIQASNRTNSMPFMNSNSIPPYHPYQEQQKSAMDFLGMPTHRSSLGALPISPLNNDSHASGQQYPKPIFQLPSQIHQPTKTISLSDSAVSKAIEAAEAMVAKEVGHITRRRRKNQEINPKADQIYECHICGKIFNRPYNLKSHQKTHSTAKPFPCKFCNKPFARSHDRKRHEKLHEGEKRFRCGGVLADGVTKWGCNRRFARADALGRHFRTETGWSCIQPLMMEATELEEKQAVQMKTEDLTNQEINKILNERHG